MFDAKADRKRFRFDVDAALKEHFESIACTVSDGEHDMFAGDKFSVGKRDAAHFSIFNFDAFDAALKANFAAQAFNRGPHIFDDLY